MLIISACQEQSNFRTQREPPGKETQVLATESCAIVYRSSDSETLSIRCPQCLLQRDCLSGANCGHRELCSRHQEDTAHLCVNSVLRPVWEALPTNPEASKIPLQASWCMIRWAAFAPAKREEQDRELLPWGIRGHSLSLKDADLHIHVLVSSCHCPGGSQVPHNSAKDQRLS